MILPMMPTTSRLLSVVGACLTTGVLLNASPTKAESDYSLLVGEWSEAGQCDVSRTVFTEDGRYQWLESSGGEWNSQFSGVYVLMTGERLASLQSDSPAAIGGVVIAEGPNMGGDVIEIHSLSQSSFSGMWNEAFSPGLSFENPEDANIDLERCPSR